MILSSHNYIFVVCIYEVCISYNNFFLFWVINKQGFSNFNAVLSYFNRVRLCNPRTVIHQAPLSMGFSRQEQWSGLPCPPPGDLPNPGTDPASLTPPASADGFFSTSATWEAPEGKPNGAPGKRKHTSGQEGLKTFQRGKKLPASLRQECPETSQETGTSVPRASPPSSEGTRPRERPGLWPLPRAGGLWPKVEIHKP